MVHKDGFSLGTLVRDSPKQPSSISAHYSLVVYQVSSSCGRGTSRELEWGAGHTRQTRVGGGAHFGLGVCAM